jgi:hypothetical protein
MSLSTVLRTHRATVTGSDRDVFVSLLKSKPFHRWDALLRDVVAHLARGSQVRYHPTHEDLPVIKKIFDMSRDDAVAHVSTHLRVPTGVARRWCDFLWVDRMHIQ